MFVCMETWDWVRLINFYFNYIYMVMAVWEAEYRFRLVIISTYILLS